jgi:hypothetical protein
MELTVVPIVKPDAANFIFGQSHFIKTVDHKVPPAGFKYLVTEMLCWAAGGPQKYTGKDMLSSHRHLRITPGQWDVFMDDWRRRSTSSQSRRPSGPRSWPSSRAHGLTSS